MNFKLEDDDRIKVNGDTSVLYGDSQTLSPTIPLKKNQSGLFRISSDKKVEQKRISVQNGAGVSGTRRAASQQPSIKPEKATYAKQFQNKKGGGVALQSTRGEATRQDEDILNVKMTPKGFRMSGGQPRLNLQ